MNASVITICLGLFVQLFSFSHVVYGQGSKEKELFSGQIAYIDSAYRAFAEEHHSPGLVYALVSGGKVIHVNTCGYADVEREILVTENSVFRIASMTKSFVAVAILQLRDAGKLRLDDPVSDYVNEFSEFSVPTSDAPDITIRHLLTHTSGLPEDDPWGDRLLDMSVDSFYQVLDAGLSFSNTPGVKYEYSNTPFALLGEIIHKVSGQPFEAYINAHVLAPLGMKATYWDSRDVPEQHLVYGYRRLDERWEKEVLYGHGVYGAMGGMWTTPGDFAKYLTMHQQAWPERDGADEQPLKRASLREMQSPLIFNTLMEYGGVLTSFAYGYGLRWTRDVNGVTTVGHTGGLPGYGSNWLMLPDYGFGLICFSNITYAPAPMINTEVALGLVRRMGLQPKPVEISGILRKRQQELVGFLPNWTSATDESSVFSSNFFFDYPVTVLQAMCQSVFRQAGNIKSVREVKPENRLRGTFRLECERQDVEVFFSLTPEASPRIQQFSIRLVGKKW